jgi:hypothetical protein
MLKVRDSLEVSQMQKGVIPYHSDMERCLDVLWLSDKTDLKPRECLVLMLKMWSYISAWGEDGFIPLFTAQILANAIGDCPVSLVEAAIEFGWIVCDERGILVPGWTQDLELFWWRKRHGKERRRNKRGGRTWQVG